MCVDLNNCCPTAICDDEYESINFINLTPEEAAITIKKCNQDSLHNLYEKLYELLNHYLEKQNDEQLALSIQDVLNTIENVSIYFKIHTIRSMIRYIIGETE